MRVKILVVDDDLTLQAIIRLSLKEFDIVQATSTTLAYKALEQGGFHAILIDIGLPDGDGLRFLSDLKKMSDLENVPVMIVSGKTDIQNKIMAFSVGADDFVSKPFDPLELYARVSAQIVKARKHLQAIQQKIIGNLLIDLDRLCAYRFENGIEQNLSLTSMEFKILVLLTQRLEQVYSREQILQKIWGTTHVSDRTVDSHVAHLRSKLTGLSVTVDTVKNMGFRAINANPINKPTR